MVFLTLVNFGRKRSSFFKKQQIFRMSGNFYGRKRNCYSIAIRYVQKALLHSAAGRKLKSAVHAESWKQRLDASCREFGYNYGTLLKGVLNSNIMLNRKIMTELAIWEPRTFESLVKVAATKVHQMDSEKQLPGLKPPPDGVITRGML